MISKAPLYSELRLPCSRGRDLNLNGNEVRRLSPHAMQCDDLLFWGIMPERYEPLSSGYDKKAKGKALHAGFP